MKKLLALMLAAALALSLVACGGGSGAGDTNTPEETTMTKEEMLEVAEEKTFADFPADNKAFAENCIGDIYKITGWVLSVESDYVRLATSTSDGKGANQLSVIYLHVYLPVSELAGLEINDEVTIVGEVTGTSEENISIVYGITDSKVCLEFENAYMV